MFVCGVWVGGREDVRVDVRHVCACVLSACVSVCDVCACGLLVLSVKVVCVMFCKSGINCVS